MQLYQNIKRFREKDVSDLLKLIINGLFSEHSPQNDFRRNLCFKRFIFPGTSAGSISGYIQKQGSVIKFPRIAVIFAFRVDPGRTCKTGWGKGFLMTP